jgi:hypothetical protein
MGSMVHRASRDPHVLRSDMRPEMAKASLDRVRKADTGVDIEPNRRAVGRCLELAAASLGWSLKETATALDADEREVAKWYSGERRLHHDRIIAVPDLYDAFVLQQAALSRRIERETVLRYRQAVTA